MSQKETRTRARDGIPSSATLAPRGGTSPHEKALTLSERQNPVDGIVDQLLRYRRQGEKLEAKSVKWRIRSEEEACQIQDQVAEAMGEAVAGWKLGAVDESARQRLKLSQPFIGRVFQSRLWSSPARLSRYLLSECKVEVEIAVRIDRDLPLRELPYDREAIASAVSGYHLAMELIDLAWPSSDGLSRFDIIADNGGCFGLVIGPSVKDWENFESAGKRAELKVDGAVVGEGTISENTGALLDRVAWLANHLNERGLCLRAGQYVATGTWTGMKPLRPNQTAKASITSLGTIELMLA